ncbi:hypothetical protein D3C78_982060 [compost metagenome]
MRRLGAFTGFRELQVQRNARFQEGTIFLADQVASPLGQAAVQNRNDIDVQTCPAKRHSYRVGLRHDLLRAEVREGLTQLFGQVINQLLGVVRCIRTAHVDRNINVAERPQGRAFRQASGDQHSPQRKAWMIGEIAFQFVL